MKEKKLQVFVSSTFEDLKEERQAAVEAILSAGHIPAGMELFAAGDESQMTVIKRWIDESDVYLLILGGRYGSIDEKSGKSYIELEFEYARSINKPSFSVVINDAALDEKVKRLGRSAIEQTYPKELKTFKSAVQSRIVRFWNDTKDIKLAIFETLSEFSQKKELTGWVKGNTDVNVNKLAEELARLTKENSELRASLEVTKNQSLVTYGGLTYKELEQMLKSVIVGNSGAPKMLFEILREKGPEIISGRFPDSRANSEIINYLSEFRLIIPAIHGWRFSDDGHKFYLKMLVNSRSK